MKFIARIFSTIIAATGIVLLAWVSYDATNVLHALEFKGRVEEATVALLTLTAGALFVGLGILSWQRARSSAAMPAA